MNANNRNEKIKRIVAMICVILVTVAFLASIIVPAASAATQAEIDKAKAETEKAKEDLKAKEKAKEEAAAQLDALDKQLSQIENEVKAMEAQIGETEKDVKKKEAELAKAEREHKEYLELFKSRARAMYENSEIDYMEIIFGAENFSDFLSKIEVVTQLINYDNGVLERLKETRDQIEAAKKKLEETLATQKANKETLEKKQQSLVSARTEKENLLKEAQKNVEIYEALVDKAEAAEAAFIKENEAAFTAGANTKVYKTDGTYNWPVPSTKYITSYYGYRIHPVYGYKKFHSGIDIGASYGADIVAMADGKVTLASWNGGYGKCVVVNHGGGLTSLYGHNSDILVSYGQEVKKGQVIAKAGSTGVSTGPHLHFEVRKNGSTTDPRGYVG